MMEMDRKTELLVEVLEKYARMIALKEMRSHGTLRPRLLIGTEETCIEYVPSSIVDEAAKDKFAQIARLLAIANSAIAITLVLETWVRSAKEPGAPLTEKTEAVSIATEAAGKHRMLLLQIERSARGKFKRLREKSPPVEEIKGRFTSLLPPRVPTEEDKRHARSLLLLMGLSPQGQSVITTLN